jgi:hypothetical protein
VPDRRGGEFALELERAASDDRRVGARTPDRRGGTALTDPTKPAVAPETKPEYGTADSILFQAWLVLFLMVVCFALVNYLLSYMPG